MSIAPVVIEFLAKGTPEISRAIRGVEQMVTGSDRGIVRSARSTGDAREREYAKVARAAEKWQREMVRNAERASAAETRASEKAATASIRASDRAASAKIRTDERAARERVRIAERAEADIARLMAKHDRQVVRQRDRFANATTGMAGRAVRGSANMVFGGAQRLAGTVAQLGGGFSVADSVSDWGNLQRNAALLSNSAFIPGKTARPDTGKIIDRAKAASAATGIDANELVMGIRGYVAKSSDYEGGMKNMEFFGKLAKGTGASFHDVANTGGILRTQNKNLDDKSMREMLLSIVAQGKSGSVELEDLARMAGKLTRTSAAYQGSQTENQRTLLGISQFAIKTAGSTDEAATAVSNVSSDALKHRGKIEGAIGSVTDKDGRLIAPEKLLERVLAGTGGNLGKIQDLGFGQRSQKVFQALAPDYQEELAKLRKSNPKMSETDARKAAAATVMKNVAEVTGSKYSPEDLEKDVAAVMKSSAEQFEQAVRQLKMEVGEKLTPELMKLLPVLQQLTPSLVKVLDGLVALANWASKNPFTAFAGLVTAFFMKELAAAMIADTIKKALGGAGGAGGGGGGGGMGGAAVPLAAGLLTYEGARPIVDSVLNGQTSGQVAAGRFISTLKHGSKDEKEQAIAELARLKNEYEGGEANMKLGRSVASTPANAIYSLLTGDKNTSAETVQKTIRARELLETEELKALLMQTMKEGIENGARSADTSGGRGAGRVIDNDAPPRNVPMSQRGGTD